MTDSRAGMTRREFVVSVSGAAIAAVANPVAMKGETAKRSRVVLIRDDECLDASGRPRPDVIQRMLDRGIVELLGVKQPAEGWRRLFDPVGITGIKTNVWEYLPTPASVEAGIKRRMAEIGIPESRLRVDDRGARRTLAACTALINARPLRTHHWAGIGGCIKNPIMFAEKPEYYHPDMCVDLATLWKLPILKDKVKLNILVALTPQFYTRGPHHFDPRFVWPYKGIFLSTDPVAIDTIGVKVLEARRRVYFGEDRPLAQLAKHVRAAGEKHGLGVWEMSRIDLVKVGPARDVLI